MRTKPSVLMTAEHLISTRMRCWALVMARNPCFFDFHHWPREALFTKVVAQVCSPWARVLMLCALRCRTRSDGFHRLVCPPHIPNLSSFGDLVFWFSIAHQLHSAKSLPPRSYLLLLRLPAISKLASLQPPHDLHTQSTLIDGNPSVVSSCVLVGSVRWMRRKRSFRMTHRTDANQGAGWTMGYSTPDATDQRLACRCLAAMRSPSFPSAFPMQMSDK